MTDTSLAAYPLPARAEIEAAARRAHRLLKPEQAAAVAKRAAIALAELSDMLLGPVAELLDRRRLLIVSDGASSTSPSARCRCRRPADRPRAAATPCP